MKTLLKTYYHQPQVDTEKIMKNLYLPERNASFTMMILPTITALGFLAIFIWFIIMLNIDFLAVWLSVYFAVGGFLFSILNILTGLLIFISQNYTILLFVTSLVFLLQIALISLRDQFHIHLR